jgi:hypothetical protein
MSVLVIVRFRSMWVQRFSGFASAASDKLALLPSPHLTQSDTASTNIKSRTGHREGFGI